MVSCYSPLTRILLQYIMIVKLRQNVTKMREFSKTKDQQKIIIMVKIFIVYEVGLCSPNGNIEQQMFPNGNIKQL